MPLHGADVAHLHDLLHEVIGWRQLVSLRT
jgi:uncharacterized protein (DUF2132 family)